MTPIRPRQGAYLCLLAGTALLAAGCHSGGHTGSQASTPPAARASASARAGAEKARTILDQEFTGHESLGSGSGLLQAAFGDTMPAAPARVKSVTFALVCTGRAKVSLTFFTDGKRLSPAARASDCDGSVFQQSIDLPTPGPVSFEADLSGSDQGGFAYSYFVEKEQTS
ncbi:hypothetical protein NX794_30990 [Streptomyces sp. LP11]|uniref:Lipoprotein n=1 Tax=Streptomyces pyxinicus TaxID=2970331 RepID=A0ABT2BB30_9ACTN|nr:hypothetical protein [Streptomyces sp. LP11]MCS0605596.1 hypothetical protein [Streptomyces sp. LP11]